LEKSLEALNSGNELNSLDESSKIFLHQTGLLSLKPKIIVCNVDEATLKEGNEHTSSIINAYPKEKVITICADIEDQLSSLTEDEKSKFMREIGLDKMGISKLIKEGYDLLDLETFFTSGKEESRAGQ
jgi:Predicted GTPase, probable translation factor